MNALGIIIFAVLTALLLPIIIEFSPIKEGAARFAGRLLLWKGATSRLITSIWERIKVAYADYFAATAITGLLVAIGGILVTTFF